MGSGGYPYDEFVPTGHLPPDFPKSFKAVPWDFNDPRSVMALGDCRTELNAGETFALYEGHEWPVFWEFAKVVSFEVDSNHVNFDRTYVVCYSKFSPFRVINTYTDFIQTTDRFEIVNFSKRQA